MKLQILTICLLPAFGLTGAIAASAAPASQAVPSRTRLITGVVHDSTGAAISGAVVIARVPARAELQALTGPDGKFSLEIASAGDVVLIVRAGGFAEHQQRPSDTAARDLDIVLAPASRL